MLSSTVYGMAVLIKEVNVDNGGLRLCCPSEPVNIYVWLKHSFVTHKVNTNAPY